MAKRITKYKFPIVQVAWALTVACLLAWGCVRELASADDPGEGTVTVTLAVTTAATKSLSDNPDGETDIKTVDVLVFQNDGYIEHVHATENPVAITLEKGSGYEFVALCNAVNLDGYADIAGWLADNAHTTKADLLTSLETLVFTDADGFGQADYAYDVTTVGTFPGFTMWGETGVVTVSTYAQFAVQAIRAVARIDVTKDVAVTNFVIKEAYLYNYSTRGLVVPLATSWTPGNQNAETTPAASITAISLPAGGRGTVDYVRDKQTYLQWNTANGKFERTIYALEAPKTDDNERLAATALVIGGDYNNSGTTTYYRVDLKDGYEAYMDILRNYQYTVNITKVTGPGHPDPDPGFEDEEANISYTITAWDVSTVDVYDDRHYTLTVSESEIGLSKEKTLSGIYYEAEYAGSATGKATSMTVTIDADADAKNKTDWLYFTDGKGITETSTVIAKITALPGDGIFCYRADANTTDAPRTATITLTWGNIIKTIHITQHAYPYSATEVGVSNCYMVQPLGIAVKFSIEATVGGIARSTVSDVLAGNVTQAFADNNIPIIQAGFLWTDCKYGLTNKSVVHRILIDGANSIGTSDVNDNLIVIPGPVAGNALISVTDALGNTGWSWHIWNTDYAPGDNSSTSATGGDLHKYGGTAFTSGTYKNSYIMDRNLGATWTANDGLPISSIMTSGSVSGTTAAKAYGMHYQWGRKDPFTPSDGTGYYSTNNTVPVKMYDGVGIVLPDPSTAAGVPELNNLVKAIQNPMTHYHYHYGWQGLDNASKSYGDWYTKDCDEANHYLWNSEAGEKTLYDPCPPGWRVPLCSADNDPLRYPWAGFFDSNPNNAEIAQNTQSPATYKKSNVFDFYMDGIAVPWTVTSTAGVGMGNSTAGRLYELGTGGDAWYPFSGYRRASNGQLMRSGICLFMHCATSLPRIGDNPPMILLFDLSSQSVYSSVNSYRSYSCTVRCIQDWETNSAN